MTTAVVDMSVDIGASAVDSVETSSDIHRLSVVRGMIRAFLPQGHGPRTLAPRWLSPPSTDAKTTDDKHYSEMNNLKSTHLPRSGDELPGSLTPFPLRQPHMEAR